MTYPLRTVLQWLSEQDVSESAECWVLADNEVIPVIAIQPTEAGDVILTTRSVWGEPTPVPLTYGFVHDTLIEEYSGGGRLLWHEKDRYIYRGSYVVNSDNAVFFLFLPDSTEIIETHDEKMEKKKAQAKQLTKEIENNGRS